MKVPRPSGGSRQSNGVGKIYVKYDTPDSARKALQALAGRKFADRTVVTTYFSEVSLVPHFYGLNEHANPSKGEFRGRRLVRLAGERDKYFLSCKELRVKGGIKARILSVLLHLPGLHLHPPNEKTLQIHEALAHCNCISLSRWKSEEKHCINRKAFDRPRCFFVEI